MVGARACSAYGSTVAQGLARELAAAGVVIVSGLARGVDAAAHRGALETGATIAVLGCGIDRDYPRAHTTLAAEVASRGLIVSEYAPGVEAGAVALSGPETKAPHSQAVLAQLCGCRGCIRRQMPRRCGLGVGLGGGA